MGYAHKTGKKTVGFAMEAWRLGVLWIFLLPPWYIFRLHARYFLSHYGRVTLRILYNNRLYIGLYLPHLFCPIQYIVYFQDPSLYATRQIRISDATKHSQCSVQNKERSVKASKVSHCPTIGRSEWKRGLLVRWRHVYNLNLGNKCLIYFRPGPNI